MRRFENNQDWAISSQATEESAEGSTTRARSPERTVKPHECATTITCTMCGVSKPLTAFSAGRKQCKPCRVKKETERGSDPKVSAKRKARKSAMYAENRERVRQQQADYYRRNREAIVTRVLQRQSEADAAAKRLEYNARRYAQKSDQIKKRQAEYRRANQAVIAARDARRRAAELQATPAWADMAEIAKVYALAQKMTQETGRQYVVDHIVPLQGRTVRGLHVHWNLRVIPYEDNIRKSNKLVEEIV